MSFFNRKQISAMSNVCPHTPIPSLLMSLQNNSTQPHSNLSVTTGFSNNTLETDREDYGIFNPFNDPRDLISEVTNKKWRRIIGYAYFLFLAVGVPANVIVCLVFYRQVWTGASMFVHSLPLLLMLFLCFCCICCFRQCRFSFGHTSLHPPPSSLPSPQTLLLLLLLLLLLRSISRA